MVCWNVAVVSATLSPEYTAELMASPDGIKALAAALARRLGVVPQIITYPNQQVIVLQAPRATLTIRAGAITVSSSILSRPECDQLAREAIEIATALAIPLAQERIVQTLKRAYGDYAVLGDRRVGDARVVKLRIPL